MERTDDGYRVSREPRTRHWDSSFINYFITILSPGSIEYAWSRRKARKRRKKRGSRGRQVCFTRGNARIIVTIIDTGRLFRHSPLMNRNYPRTNAIPVLQRADLRGVVPERGVCSYSVRCLRRVRNRSGNYTAGNPRRD